MHAKDDDGNSQWAVLLDPNGAAFGIVPVVPSEAVPPIDPAALPDPEAIGRIAWLDLTVAGATATRDFYRQVIGWSVQEVEMEDEGENYVDYNMLSEDGSLAAGICHARGGNAVLPPVWIIYLTVGDLDESLRRVPGEGGKVLKAVQGDNGEYVYAVVQDPLGVYLGLLPA